MAKGSQSKNKNESDFELKIRPKKWTTKETAEVKTFIKAHEASRTPQQRLRNKLNAIKYQMQDYADNEKLTANQMISLETFFNLHLKALDLPFKKFAIYIDTTDKNLKKCISGEYKFNSELACKFANFFHTTPDLWFKVYLKNQLLDLEKDRKQLHKYKKYNYKNVLAA